MQSCHVTEQLNLYFRSSSKVSHSVDLRILCTALVADLHYLYPSSVKLSFRLQRKRRVNYENQVCYWGK